MQTHMHINIRTYVQYICIVSTYSSNACNEYVCTVHMTGQEIMQQGDSGSNSDVKQEMTSPG